MVVDDDTRFYVFETRGGALITEVEPSDYDWSERSNTSETVNMRFVDRPEEWRNLFTPWKHSIAVDAGGHLLGGPILPIGLDGDKEELSVTARGFLTLLGTRKVLPLAALTQPIAPDGIPDPSMDTIIGGVDHGTIGSRLVQQACTWPGWTDIPISYHPDRAGTRSESYKAVQGKRVNAALADLTKQKDGPDIRIQLVRLSEDQFGWVYQSGTEEQPRLQGDVPLEWEALEVSGLGIDVDPSRMGSMFWSTGGRDLDKVVVRGLYDPYLVDRGFPLMELDSDASTSTSDATTLDSWNAELARTARSPWDFWQFRVPMSQSPLPYEYGCGDLATVYLSPQQQHRLGLLSSPHLLSGVNVLSGGSESFDVPGFLPARPYTRRIAGMSGSSRARGFISLTFAEAYDG
ncbi:hypothetical protein SK224_16465 [Microbacterium sp. BG28]|uniref:hypothetical protein n=1 Tax=Microbacterium sp. BG28 TaxID=3097356 RepID=UPI002A5AFE39|nr:hypothetical protein [Microbacterium sp. BG28]MDY0830730.1 hypothetical protein [Microbacterium sp. BG28]